MYFTPAHYWLNRWIILLPTAGIFGLMFHSFFFIPGTSPTSCTKFPSLLLRGLASLCRYVLTARAKWFFVMLIAFNAG